MSEGHNVFVSAIYDRHLCRIDVGSEIGGGGENTKSSSLATSVRV